ncbi:MAG: altronate dehydratase family protein [Gemmatimonadaceae bacterium]
MNQPLSQLTSNVAHTPTNSVAGNTGPLAVRVHLDDNVAVALSPLTAGTVVHVGEENSALSVTLGADIPAGHKIALRALNVDESVFKYGVPIGRITTHVDAGGWVHSHNLATRLTDAKGYERRHHADAVSNVVVPSPLPTFNGYHRADGRTATRNEIWIVNTVGCVNTAAGRIARAATERFKDRIDGIHVDGIHAFAHPYGCSQLGDDLSSTRAVLGGLLRHPNVGGALVLGLGCENNQLPVFLRSEAPADLTRLRAFNTQDVVDEEEAGVLAIGELIDRMASDNREARPISELVLGHKCGGSDGFSGLSANPLLGRLAERITAMGGTVLLTEVPEMFGAEQVLLDRVTSDEVYDAATKMIDDFKAYFVRHNQPVYENPSPGNKDGGLTTLEEKSLGAIQKGGRAPVTGVLRYGEAAHQGGLQLLEAPGNDGVSSTAMVASGATVLLFTTGRGTPLGFPVPTLKVSSNSGLAERKPHWIDFDAGRVLTGAASMEQLTDDLLALVIDTASGKLARNETHGYREIAIWKHGVTL